VRDVKAKDKEVKLLPKQLVIAPFAKSTVCVDIVRLQPIVGCTGSYEACAAVQTLPLACLVRPDYEKHRHRDQFIVSAQHNSYSMEGRTVKGKLTYTVTAISLAQLQELVSIRTHQHRALSTLEPASTLLVGVSASMASPVPVVPSIVVEQDFLVGGDIEVCDMDGAADVGDSNFDEYWKCNKCADLVSIGSTCEQCDAYSVCTSKKCQAAMTRHEKECRECSLQDDSGPNKRPRGQK